MKKISKSSCLIASASLFALCALAGCNGEAGTAGGAEIASSGGNGNGSTTSPGDPAGSGNPTDTGSGSSQVAVGESCVTSDPNKICLAVHFVAYKDSSGRVTASESQAATIISTMNELFGQCDIGFQIETYEAVDPTVSGLAYGAASQNQLDQIRRTYNTRSDELLGVTTGPWGTAVNGWTNMPGSGVYGAIMEASIVDYDGGSLYAHEFGHYLGLDHASDPSNLMSPVIYSTSDALTSSQCATAKATIQEYWSAMVRS